MGTTPKAVVEFLARSLVNHPERVQVREIAGAHTDILEVSVAPGELGFVIGRAGRMADAIRHIASAVAHRQGRSVRVDFVDSRDGRPDHR